MWPFKKDSAGPPPSGGKGDELIPPDEMRRMLAKEGYMIEGPFPIREPGDGGHLMCKNCGAAYRDFTWEPPRRSSRRCTRRSPGARS